MRAIKKKVTRKRHTPVRHTPVRASASPAKHLRPQQTFEPTPAADWGDALRHYNAPKLSGKRWLQDPEPAPAAAVAAVTEPVASRRDSARLMDDPNFDWDMVVLDGWSFSYNGSRPLQLTGRVFNSAGGFEEGDLLEYTSQVIAANGRIVKTKSGTSYFLGQPDPSFGPIRMQLVRQGGCRAAASPSPTPANSRACGRHRHDPSSHLTAHTRGAARRPASTAT